MKKRHIFGLVLAALTVAAAICRHWQRATAFEPETELLISGRPATGLLLAVLVVAAVAFLPLGRWCARGGEVKSYLRAFSLPKLGLVLVYVAAGALLVGAGALGVWQYRLGVDDRLGRFLLSIVLIPTGIDMAMVSWLGTQRRESEGRFAWPLLLPGYCGCLWLVTAYQTYTSVPNVQVYAFYLFGILCAAGCCYGMASFSFEKPMPVWTLWTGAMAVIFLATRGVDAVDTCRPFELLVCLGYALYVAAQIGCLATRCEQPAQLEAWEPPAECEDPADPQDPAEATEEVETEAMDRE